jgi:hypothetical protein
VTLGALPRAVVAFARLAVAVAVALFGVALLVSGCGQTTDGKKNTSCEPGRTLACTGGDGCAGHQVCADDGSAFGACTCAGDETFPSTGPASGLAGANCEDDGDCRKGSFCLTYGSRALDGEGPAGGICVAECARDASVCEKLDADATCVVLDDRGTSSVLDDTAFCLPRCKLGDAASGEEKCRGRVDLVCSEAAAGSGQGYCRPACRSDRDCGSRLCNLRTGLCGDAPPSGDPIGSACNPEESHCAGGCIDHGSNWAECSGVCRLNTPGCGQTSSRPPYDYWCYLDPSNVGGDGDLGYCAHVCDCDDDCGRDDAVCEPSGSLESDTGRAGVCASKTYASGGARPHVPCR